MNKQDLANEIVKETKLTKKDTLVTLDALFLVMADALADGEEIAIPHFGKFKTVIKKERSGVNPQNVNERIVIPEKRYPKFLPSSVLKRMVDKR